MYNIYMEDNDDYNKLIDSLDVSEMDQLMLALDTNDPNPHGNDFEVDDRDVQTYVLDYNQEDKDFNKEVRDLSDYPDYSDKVINDYLMNQINGIERPVPPVVDLDTAPNYVDFVNLSIKNMLQFENEFNENARFDRIRELLKE